MTLIAKKEKEKKKNERTNKHKTTQGLFLTYCCCKFNITLPFLSLLELIRSRVGNYANRYRKVKSLKKRHNTQNEENDNSILNY